MKRPPDAKLRPAPLGGNRRAAAPSRSQNAPAPIETDFPYFVTVVPGLEPVAEEEIRSLSRRAKIGPSAKGVVAFDIDRSPDELLQLRCAEDLFATLAWLPSLPDEEAGTQRIFRALQRAPLWDDALELHRMAIPPSKKRRATYRVVAQLEGRRDFRRQDMKRAAEDAIERRTNYAWDRVEDRAFLEIWVRAERETAAIGIRLSDNAMRHRSYKVVQLPASLKPTVAAAMIRLTRPQPEETFLDPMCGSGTLLIERALAGRYGLLLGGDADPNALDAAMANVGRRYQPIRLQKMDARRLPLETASVDKIASNLPFGRRIGAPEDLPALYEEVFSEFARVLKPGGRAVLLVSHDGEWKELLEDQREWTSRRRLRIDLLGQRPTILVLDRNERLE
jgi:23S rRNA G2445 N2-methylase RlmL